MTGQMEITLLTDNFIYTYVYLSLDFVVIHLILKQV